MAGWKIKAKDRRAEWQRSPAVIDKANAVTQKHHDIDLRVKVLKQQDKELNFKLSNLHIHILRSRKYNGTNGDKTTGAPIKGNGRKDSTEQRNGHSASNGRESPTIQDITPYTNEATSIEPKREEGTDEGKDDDPDSDARSASEFPGTDSTLALYESALWETPDDPQFFEKRFKPRKHAWEIGGWHDESESTQALTSSRVRRRRR